MARACVRLSAGVCGIGVGSWVERAVEAAPTAPPDAGPPSSSWIEQVQKQVESAEYAVSWQAGAGAGAGGYQAPNRAHGFRTSFSPQGIRAVPRVDAETGWEWGL